MPSPFDLPFVQRGVVEIVLLAFGAGVIGTWIVLRGLAFYAHAVGTAAFPGLVLADGIGFSASLGAAATGTLVAAGVTLLARRRDTDQDSATALVLVAALACGVILASDVFHSGSNVETLLFGSLLLVDGNDIALAAAASAAALLAARALEPRWLVRGFDPRTAPALGAGSAFPDAVLLGAVTLLVVAALSTLGALLATAIMIVPAATTRLVFARIGPWQLATVGLVALEGVAGLWLSVETNAPPGATIAVLSGAVFAVVAVWRAAGPRRRAATAALAGGVLLAVAGCGSSTGGDGRLKVVATTTQLGDIVRNVAGPDAAVTQILRPNTDPHEYEPRPKDVLDTARARVVFESGDNLDRWMGDVIEQSGGKPVVYDVSKDVPYRLAGESTGPEASRYDPHWWHDPLDVAAVTTAVGKALGDADGAHAARYAARAAAYRSRVERLAAVIAQCFRAIGRAQRTLVTDHDAFGYFARRYGITVVGAVIASQSTQAQPSARAVARLARTIRREHVRAIFPESSLNSRLVRAIARQTGASSAATLYGDTLGPAGSAGDTYLHMELANANAMARGFTGGARGCAGP